METEPRRHGPQTTSQSPVPPKCLVVNRDLADYSIATTWSRLEFPALCGITELVPDGAPLDANIAQWDLYVKEIDDQFGSPLGEDKIFYTHEGAVRPVMNNATLRAGLRWMKQDPSLTDNELRFYRWSPEGTSIKLLCPTLSYFYALRRLSYFTLLCAQLADATVRGTQAHQQALRHRGVRRR
jgi:hypothetical protein